LKVTQLVKKYATFTEAKGLFPVPTKAYLKQNKIFKP